MSLRKSPLPVLRHLREGGVWVSFKVLECRFVQTAHRQTVLKRLEAG